MTAVTLTLADLDAPGASLASAVAWLTPAERARSEALQARGPQRRFIIGRAVLRALLEATATAGDFRLGPNGKPSLPGAPHFSFAASERYALIGVSHDEPIGVDIEIVRDVAPVADWAERYPVLGAMRRGRERTGDSAAVRFLRAWTRLEAATKRDGGRLGRALDLAKLPADTGPILAGVKDVDLGAGLVAALATNGTPAIELRTADVPALIAGG